MVWTYLLVFLIAGTVCSWAFILFASDGRWSHLFLSEDQPHHTHTEQTSRIGGIGIIGGFAVSYLLFFILFDYKDNQSLMHYSIFIGALACFTLGLVDDLKPIDARLKFVLQIIIAVFAHESGLSIDRLIVPFFEWDLDLQNFSLILTVFWFVSIINLINLIDGLDGLAGGIGLMLMILLIFLSFEKGVSITTFLSVGMAGAILGFLIHNFPPARVYMGDSGAYTIGFVIAALSLMNFQKGAVIAALLGPMMALALPIIDVSFALFRRSAQGLPLFRPDKGHIHHQLIRLGLSRKNTVLVLYAFSMVALLGGILVYSNQGRYFPIFVGLASVIIIFALRVYGNPLLSLKQLFSDSFSMRYETQNAIRLSRWLVAEVDRIRNGGDFWNEYQWFLKKLGFDCATVRIDGEERSYVYAAELINEYSQMHQSECFITDKPKGGNTIQFWADKGRLSERRFRLNCEIAFEAWISACKRWQVLNEEAYRFDGQAQKQTSEMIEKARDLYLP